MAKPRPIEPLCAAGEFPPPPAAAERRDRRVDADQFAVHVHQGAAGVTRIDRRIGLDRVEHRVLSGTTLASGGDGAIQRADDARRDRALQPERGADGNHVLADLQILRRSQCDGRESRKTLGPNDGDVARGVGADDAERRGAAVGQRHRGLHGLTVLGLLSARSDRGAGLVLPTRTVVAGGGAVERGHHVVVGQDQTIGVQDDAGTLFASVAHVDLQLHHAGHHLGSDLLDRTGRRRGARRVRGGRVGGRHVGSRGQCAGETACGRMVGLGGKHQCAGARGDHGHGRGTRDHEPGARTFPRLRLTDGRYRLGNEGVTIEHRVLGVERNANRRVADVCPERIGLDTVGPHTDSVRADGPDCGAGTAGGSSCRGVLLSSNGQQMLGSTVHAATETRLRVGSIQPKTFRPHTRPAARCTRQIRFGRTYSGDPLRPLSQCGFGGGMVERPRRRAV